MSKVTNPPPPTLPVIACVGDGRFHLSVRLPDGYGFQVSWSDETSLCHAISVLSNTIKEPNGLREGMEKMVHYFGRKSA